MQGLYRKLQSKDDLLTNHTDAMWDMLMLLKVAVVDIHFRHEQPWVWPAVQKLECLKDHLEKN